MRGSNIGVCITYSRRHLIKYEQSIEKVVTTHVGDSYACLAGSYERSCKLIVLELNF